MLTDDEKAALISLAQVLESLWTHKLAYEHADELHLTPPHLTAFLVSATGDLTIGALTRVRFQAFYDSIGHAPDVSTALKSLLALVGRTPAK
jgi:hypothetical protein